MTRSSLVFFAVIALGGCDSRQTEANETALLLQRVQSYTDSEGPEQETSLEALRAFKPTSSRVREARDSCVAAYSLVERAERDHETAKKLLGEVTSGKRQLGETRGTIEGRIDRSNRAIEEARPRINRCTRLLSDLKRETRQN
ncbi:MAG: hypothetical protein HYY06_12620 [Deltaproteobacteria bacterium]|nr:hypothetical protein [Deltaproteobacteria bacterium]